MNRRALRRAISNALCGAMLLAGGASAQTVYRCGPEGRSYSQSPCTEGRAVDVSDVRSDAQRREASQVTQRQEALGRSMESQRRKDESARPMAAGSLGHATPTPQAAASSPARSSRKKKSRPHAAESDSRTTVVVPARPRSPKG